MIYNDFFFLNLKNYKYYFQKMFLKSDIQADNALELKEIIEWVESNTKAMELFSKFGKKKKNKKNKGNKIYIYIKFFDKKFYKL
jgi:hypothetical protein